jgi:ketosteroid isomerase-like protein
MEVREMGVRTGFLVFVFLGLAASGTSPKGETSEIEGFNRKFVELILTTDHRGMLATWAEDGVDLMPGEAPLVGKAAITKWIKNLESRAPGSNVTSEDVRFHDIQVSEDWASEWATERQIVQPQGKPPIEGYGKIALVLHRDKSGQWKIKQEMWNDAPHP